MEKTKHIEDMVRNLVSGFTHPLIKEIRYMGGCLCFQVHDPSCLIGFREYAYQRGVFFKTISRYYVCHVSVYHTG